MKNQAKALKLTENLKIMKKLDDFSVVSMTWH